MCSKQVTEYQEQVLANDLTECIVQIDLTYRGNKAEHDGTEREEHLVRITLGLFSRSCRFRGRSDWSRGSCRWNGRRSGDLDPGTLRKSSVIQSEWLASGLGSSFHCRSLLNEKSVTGALIVAGKETRVVMALALNRLSGICLSKNSTGFPLMFLMNANTVVKRQTGCGCHLATDGLSEEDRREDELHFEELRFCLAVCVDRWEEGFWWRDSLLLYFQVAP